MNNTAKKRRQPRRSHRNRRKTRFEHLESRRLLAAEIDLIGNGTSIRDGDIDPSTSDVDESGFIRRESASGQAVQSHLGVNFDSWRPSTPTDDTNLSTPQGLIGSEKVHEGGLSTANSSLSEDLWGTGFRVVLDPGHGGTNIGTSGMLSRVAEKVLNLDIAKKLRHELEQLGFEVTLTREDDSDPGFEDRSTAAKNFRADWFVSLHFNGLNPPPDGGDPIRGTQAFVKPSGNVNLQDDLFFADTLKIATMRSFQQPIDLGTIERDHPFGVLDDLKFGNSKTYSPVVSTLLEIESISSNEDVDRFFNAAASIFEPTPEDVELQERNRTRVAEEIARGFLEARTAMFPTIRMVSATNSTYAKPPIGAELAIRWETGKDVEVSHVGLYLRDTNGEPVNFLEGFSDGRLTANSIDLADSGRFDWEIPSDIPLDTDLRVLVVAWGTDGKRRDSKLSNAFSVLGQCVLPSSDFGVMASTEGVCGVDPPIVLSTFTAAPNPTPKGQPITLTVNGTGEGADVQFLRDSNRNGKVDPNDAPLRIVPLAGGVAQHVTPTANLSPGVHSYMAIIQQEDGTWSNPLTVPVTVTRAGNPLPTIGSLVASPNPVDFGDQLVLTAYDVIDDDRISNVQFVWDADRNGQYDTGTDKFLGSDNTVTNGSANVTFNASDLEVGNQQILARARDNEGAFGTWVTTTVDVTTISTVPIIGALLTEPVALMKNGAYQRPWLVASGVYSPDGSGISKVEFYRDEDRNGRLDKDIDTFLFNDYHGNNGWAYRLNVADYPEGRTDFLAVATSHSGLSSRAVGGVMIIQPSDHVPPRVSNVSVADVSTAGSLPMFIDVTFTDNIGVDVSDIDTDFAIKVTGSNHSAFASYVATDNLADGTPRTATYRLESPPGGWDFSLNGTYIVSLETTVADLALNQVPQGAIAEFEVNIPYVDTTPPVVSLDDLSTNLAEPTLIQSDTITLAATAEDPESGIASDQFRFFVSRWNGVSWGSSIDYGASEGVMQITLPGGLYRVYANAKNGGGLSANSTVAYFQVAVNEPPTLDSIPDPLAVLEDTGEQTVTLSGITAGTGETQPLEVSARSDKPELIPHPAVTYSFPDTIGSISYVPATNASGTAEITVSVTDGGLDGDLASAGDNRTTERRFTVRVTAVNDMPTGIMLSDGTIEESIDNETDSFPIGALIAVDPDQGDTFSFSLVTGDGDTDNDSFEVVGNELRIKPGVPLDHETKDKYAVRLQVTDSGGHVLQKSFAISVLDVNEAPTTLTLSNQSVSESGDANPGSQPIGFLTGVDPDQDDTLTYSLTEGAGDTDNDSFEVVGSELRVKPGVVLDHETKDTYAVRVEVVDSGGLSLQQAFTINVSDRNEEPTDLSLSNRLVDEAADTGSGPVLIGTLTGVDPDQGETLVYSLAAGDGDSDNDSFEVVGDELHVKQGVVLDHETKDQYFVRLQVTDSGELGFQKAFTINVLDVNEAPTGLTLSNHTVDETADTTSGSVVVGLLAGVDPDQGDTLGYSLAVGAGDTDNDSFEVSGNELRVKQGVLLDHETQDRYAVRLQVTDIGGLAFQMAFNIDVLDANDLPTLDTIPNPPPILEDAGVQTINLSGITAGAGETQPLMVTATSDNPQLIADPTVSYSSPDSSGSVEYMPVTDASGTAEITVTVTDAGLDGDLITTHDNLSTRQTFTVTVTAVNDPPSVSDQTVAIDENSPNGVSVATVSAADIEGQTLLFAIADGNPNNAFAIDSSTGQITVHDSASLDHETAPRYTLTIDVTDDGVPARTSSGEITIDVSDVNEFEPVVAPATFDVFDDSPSGASVGVVLASDEDTSQTLSFAITEGNTGGAFEIDPVSGVISIADDAVLDYETNPVYTLTVQVTDSGLPPHFSTAMVTINVMRRNHPPIAGDDFFVMDEDTTLVMPDTVLLANDSDDDGDLRKVTGINCLGNCQGTFGTHIVNGSTTLTYTPPENFFGDVTFGYNLTDGQDGGEVVGTIYVTVLAINDPPIANDDTFAVDVDSPAESLDVLANDFTPANENETLTITQLTPPDQGGSATIVNGRIEYAPPAGFVGQETFSYTINDGTPGSDGTATVTVTVGSPPPSDATLYFALEESTVLGGGLLVENEDIVAFREGQFTKKFDGSDVGLSGFEIDALAMVSPTEILMSFASDGQVPGIAGDVAKSDVVKFTAASLGEETQGTFEIFFAGSDFGFDGHFDNVDAVDLLADGRLLISSSWLSVTIAGVSASDEDLLALTPATTGDYSSGTWELYFDAGDVGLYRDVNGAAHDPGGNILLTTDGNFSVDGLSGGAADVFVFSPSSLGSTTDGTFVGEPLLDADAHGLGSENVVGFDLTTGPAVPSISISEASVLEGDAGLATVSLAVTLSEASDELVSVDYFTADGTAAAPDDYASIPLTSLTFEPGETVKNIDVAVQGDTVDEPNETLWIHLVNPTNVVIGGDQGMITIVDDDEPPPTLTIDDVSVVESDSGGAAVVFTVTRSGDASVTSTVQFSTADGSATVADHDYASQSGSLLFAPGERFKTIEITVYGDEAPEPDENFFVDLYAATGATIEREQGVGTITTDDATPPAGQTFFVMDDSDGESFHYDASGNLLESFTLAPDNDEPRGAAANASGTRLWVIDDNEEVHVYDGQGNSLGSWEADGLVSPEGIASDGVDIWIVDGMRDEVFHYADAANRLSGSQQPSSSFDLASANRRAYGITTDGAFIWVVDSYFNSHVVFKYTLSGDLVGSWTIDSDNEEPRGITIDPTGTSDSIWIVDASSDQVFEYENAVAVTSGSRQADHVFALAQGNSRPEGIADPPVAARITEDQAAAMGPAGDVFDVGFSAVAGPTHTELPYPWPQASDRTVRYNDRLHDHALRTLVEQPSHAAKRLMLQPDGRPRSCRPNDRPGTELHDAPQPTLRQDRPVVRHESENALRTRPWQELVDDAFLDAHDESFGPMPALRVRGHAVRD